MIIVPLSNNHCVASETDTGNHCPLMFTTLVAVMSILAPFAYISTGSLDVVCVCWMVSLPHDRYKLLIQRENDGAVGDTPIDILLSLSDIFFPSAQTILSEYNMRPHSHDLAAHLHIFCAFFLAVLNRSDALTDAISEILDCSHGFPSMDLLACSV